MAHPRSSTKHDSSITPQRKHRKLLKDGSGTEVWPESIEKIFVQGLREYWESPYATYSQSRGRSRWRNQFLVDYLNKQGIERSKKQVASHIQVLRNMWKGDPTSPEFHLVAGGDELYPENDSPGPNSVKLEGDMDSNSLIPFDWDHDDLPSSNSVSPNFSPADSQSEFPPTPEHRPNLLYPDFNKLAMDFQYPSPSISPNGDYIQQLPPFHDSSSFGLPYNTKYASSAQAPAAPYSAPPSASASSSTHRSTPSAPVQPHLLSRQLSATPTTHYRYPASPAPPRPTNKVTSIHLHADGMTPFSVKVDALALPSAGPAQVQPPFSLRIRLAVPLVSDVRAPQTLCGFLSAVSLENVWSSAARCVTRVYANGSQTSAEAGALSVTNISVGTVNAALPESALSKCRWLDPAPASVLTQEIIVDDETLLFVIYELDRRNGGPMPSATLLGYQKYRASTSAASSGGAGAAPKPTLSSATTAPGYHYAPNGTLGAMHTPSPVSPFSSASNNSSSGAHAGLYPRSGTQYALSPQALAAATMRRSF